MQVLFPCLPLAHLVVRPIPAETWTEPVLLCTSSRWRLDHGGPTSPAQHPLYRLLEMVIRMTCKAPQMRTSPLSQQLLRLAIVLGSHKSAILPSHHVQPWGEYSVVQVIANDSAGSVDFPVRQECWSRSIDQEEHHQQKRKNFPYNPIRSFHGNYSKFQAR